MRAWERWVCILLVSVTPVFALAQNQQPSEIDRPESPAPAPHEPEPASANAGLPTNWDHITDDWFGLRPKLENHGLVFSGTVVNDWAKNLRGGVNTEGSDFGQLLNANFTINTEKAGWWSGGRIFASFQNEVGEFA